MTLTVNNNLSKTNANATYLRLDCSNDPLTNNLDLSSHNLTTTGNIIGGILTDNTATLNAGTLTNVKLGSLINTGFVTTLGSDGTLSIDTTNYLSTVNAASQYLKLDTSNDPLTGNLEISKADPEIRLTDTGNSEYTRWTKSDTNNQMTLYNRVAVAEAIDAYTKLLLHCDGIDGSTTFTDSSPSGHVVTAVGNAQIDTADKKFGTGSGLFDGSGDYLTLPDSNDWDFGSGDWTIDFWTNLASYAATIFVAINYNSDLGSYGYSAIHLGLQNDGTIRLWMSSDGNSWDLAASVNPGSNLSIPSSSWHHVALVRNGTSVTAYVDGVAGDNPVNVGASSFYAGTRGSIIATQAGETTTGIPGAMDEIRISKGIARWTTGFTPPTSAYGSGTSYAEAQLVKSVDSGTAGEYGVNTFGDSTGRAVLDGDTIRFNIGGVEEGQIDASGNWNLEDSNFTTTGNLSATTITATDLVATGTLNVSSYSNFGSTVNCTDLYATGTLNVVGASLISNTLNITTDFVVGGKVTLTETDTPTVDPGWTLSSVANMNNPDTYIKITVGAQAYVVPAWNT